jgi:hypothetical protein
MSGEILRAVLDQSCAYSAPKFYTIDFLGVAGGAQDVSSFLQTKQDRYFLVTGLALGMFATGNGYVENTPAQLQVKILRSSRILYNNGNIPNLLCGQDFNAQVTFPEYILIEPAETILANIITAAGVAAASYTLTLYGIEYAR